MKTNTTINRTKKTVKALGQSEQFTAPEFHKYIILLWNGREQVTVFPFEMRHAEVFHYMKRECPELEAVRAGFFFVDNGSVWCTGDSESLQLSSRPEDARALESFFASPDQQPWDLVRLCAEAQAASRATAATAC
ncbi:MAG: hypothetical protein ABSH48_25915 [Verrucomicrobiota bacterium]|jgi:hypothetical protein